MSLKSLVNKSVIKSDLRRYWWLGALFAGMLFLTTAIPARMTMNSDYYMSLNADLHFVGSRFSNAVMASPFIIIGFCLVIPAMLYSYLHHKSAVSAAHSLPLIRGCLYFSHLFSSGILIAAAIVINAGLMLTMVNTSAWFIFIWMCLSLVYAFVVMTFTAAASMLVGNVAAGVILPFIVMLLPLFAMGMMQELCSNYLYGYVDNNIFKYLDWIYFDYEKLLHGWAFFYIGLGIVFIIMGLVFYKKRSLENHSRILAFDALNPVFMYGLAMCAGLAGYAYISAVMNLGSGTNHSMWIGVPFGIAGIIIARMIIAKTFKPRGIIKPIIIYIAMMGVVYLFFGVDITGFEKRVPDIGDIESINVRDLYSDTNTQEHFGYNPNYPGDNIYIAESAIHDSSLYEESDIETVLALHKAIIENEPEKGNYYLPVVYKLSNGKVMKRQYHIDRDNEEVRALYTKVQELKPVKGDQFPIISDIEIEYTGSNAKNFGVDSWLDWTRQSQLLEALKKDVEASKFDTYEFANAITQFHLEYRLPSLDENKQPITNKDYWAKESIDYNIYPSYTNCVALLTEWGLYNKMPPAEDIASINVEGFIQTSDTADGIIAYRSDTKNVTDKAEIQKILDHLMANAEHMSDPAYMANGETQSFSISYQSGKGGWFGVRAPKMAD